MVMPFLRAPSWNAYCCALSSCETSLMFRIASSTAPTSLLRVTALAQRFDRAAELQRQRQAHFLRGASVLTRASGFRRGQQNQPPGPLLQLLGQWRALEPAEAHRRRLPRQAQRVVEEGRELVKEARGLK